MSTGSLTALHKLITPACSNVHSCSQRLYTNGNFVLPVASFRAPTRPIGCCCVWAVADRSPGGEGRRRYGWREGQASSSMQRLVLTSGAMAALVAAYSYDRQKASGGGGSLGTLVARVCPTLQAKGLRRQVSVTRLASYLLKELMEAFVSL